MVTVIQVTQGDELFSVRALFEYAASLNFDLCFQGFNEGLANLPGNYAPPEGRLLLALHLSEAAGCVALQRLEDGACEVKRLYVRPRFRRLGIGRTLAETIVFEARKIGYKRMCLDTVPSMREAQILYQSMVLQRCGTLPLQPAVWHEVYGARSVIQSVQRGLTLRFRPIASSAG